MRIIKFSNGLYGVRDYWLFGWYFVDLTAPQFSWRQGSRYGYDIRGSLEQAQVARTKKMSLSYEVTDE